MTATARKLLEALEMWDDGVALVRAKLRRENPGVSDTEIEDAVGRWLAAGPDDEPDRRVHRSRANGS